VHAHLMAAAGARGGAHERQRPQRLDGLHGGLGVMADDAMAAVYANLTLRAIMAASQWV